MDKRYQVFVSSTFEDLQEERKEVMQALLELDCIPAGMELFPASNDDQWSLIKRVIDDCDYYLLIIGGRYGSENENGISYTQMEFEYALETGKPIISFLPKHPENIPLGKCDNDKEKQEKLTKFKDRAKMKLIKYWENSAHLGSVVSRSMIRLIKDFPAEGWVKSGSAIDEKSVHEIAKLQRENEELREKLRTIATEAPKGTEEFSQGEDEIEITYTFTASEPKGYQNYNCTMTELFSWNALFSCAAPSMIDECTNSAFYHAYGEFLQNSSSWNEDEGFSELVRARDFKLTQESFDLIKVQLKALGLICVGDKKRSSTDKQTYWKLTPYGDYVMTQLLAIRK